MKNTFIKSAIFSLAAVATASSALAISLPSGMTPMTDTSGGGQQNQPPVVQVCQFTADSGAVLLNSLNYATDGSKHYLYNTQQSLLDGALTTAGYTNVVVDTEVDVANTLTANDETSQVNLAITQGGGTTENFQQIAVNGLVDLNFDGANSAFSASSQTIDIQNASIDFKIDTLIIESASGFGSFVTTPKADVTLSCTP